MPGRSVDGHTSCIINGFTWAMSAAASTRDSASILPSLQKTRAALEEGENKFQIKFQTRAPQRRDWRLGRVYSVPSCVSLGMVWLLVIFLPSMRCDQSPVSYSFSEIIIPQRLTSEGREGSEGKASYMLSMRGHRQVIHLRVKTGYFVSDFPVFSYHSGSLRQERPSVSQDCHYEGYIEGVPGSFVSVNTCSGLKGILIKEEQFYGIKPMKPSEQFEHKLYIVAQPAPVSCSVTSKKSQGVSTSQQRRRRKARNRKALPYLWSYPKYVEMFVVVDHQRFQMWGSHINETIQGVMDIIALANIFTKGINTEVVLAGMEIWTEGDLIEVLVDLQGTLRNFNSWRQQELSHRVMHDVAHLIVGHHPGQNMGQAFLSGACSRGFAAAVEAFHQEEALLSAALMVHELGHNLGIQHDHSACICREKSFCLMHQNITKEGGFSNCSAHSFYQFLQEHKGACLFNKPGPKVRMRRNPNCGNSVVEETEECDCGPVCDSHSCCDASCKLKENAECSDGLCCSSCKFQPKGHMCRAADDECGLPEFCDGLTAQCPLDTFKLDGTPCERVNYCVGGHCKSPDNQCMNIFGYQAKSAPVECYTKMNSKGDRFGNCGRPTTSNPQYVQCSDDNIFCGKIVCTNIMTLSVSLHRTVIQIPHKDDWCFGIDAYAGTDIPDEGDVETGTYCGPQKVCINNTCTDFRVLNYDCDPAGMCNGKGVCNNLQHCYCDYGFAPPDCKEEGTGGSVDSGPPGKREESPSEEQSEKKRFWLNLLTLLLIFLLLLCLLICCTCMYLSRKRGAAEKLPPGPPPEAPEEASEEASEEEPPEEESPEEEGDEEEEELGSEDE